MNFLDSPLRDYILHESAISDIHYNDSEIELIFKQGFYTFEHKELANCKIIFTIKRLCAFGIDSFTSVTQIKRTKKDIPFNNFIEIIQKHGFKVIEDYYSEFERAALIIGKVLDSEYCLKITDINDIRFIHENVTDALTSSKPIT